MKKYLKKYITVLDLCHLEWYENRILPLYAYLRVLDLCHLEWYENIMNAFVDVLVSFRSMSS